MRTRVLLGVMIAMVGLAGVAGAAQAPAPQAGPATQQTSPSPPCPGAARPLAGRPGVITGLVLSARGDLRHGVTVRLSRHGEVTPLSGGADVRYTETDSDGRFQFEGLVPDCYTATVVGDRSPPSGGQRFTLPADTGVTVHLVTRQAARWAMALVALSILVYAAALLAFRHHNIVHTNRQLLWAQLANIRTRIPLESDPSRAHESQVLVDRLEKVYTGIEDRLGWVEWLFWSRGREIAAWNKLHEVERQLIAFLVPEARVMERAITAEASLRVLASPPAIVLADRIRITVQQIMDATQQGAEHAPDHLLDHLKQQLAEALTILYNDSDTKFAGLMEWHNKAMWMVYLSLLLIAVLAFVLQHEVLFLLGAAGGLMSRMARSLFRADVPSDYGASWTTLFLSPLLGAISAWFGIALITWLTEMSVLGSAFGHISWDGEVDAVLIAIAFTLGFSERLFTSLLSSVEGKMAAGLKAGSMPPAPAPAPAPLKSQDTAADGTVVHEAGARTAAASPSDLAVRDLDLVRGERVAFVSDRQTPTRSKIAAIVGADNVFDVAPDGIAALAPLDAVLFESTSDSTLTVAGLTAAAGQLPAALRADGRVVFLGRTPAALFDADTAALIAAETVGPTLVKESFATASSGIVSQEPPAAFGGTDPVEWMASFVKPAPGGADR